MTKRRRVRAATIRHIGKEANDWERQAVLGLSADAQPMYGVGAVDPHVLAAELRPLIDRWRVPACAKVLGISVPTLRKLADLSEMTAEATRQTVAERLPAVKQLLERIASERANELRSLNRAISSDGLRATARRLGADASNLSRKLKTSTVRQAVRET